MDPHLQHFEETKKILRLVPPVLSASIFGALMEMSDVFICSRSSELDLLMISKAGALWHPVLLLLQGSLLNLLSLITRFRVGQKYEKLRETCWNGLWLAMGLSLLGFLLLSLFPYCFSSFLSGENIYIDQMAGRYCRILRWGSPAFFLLSLFKTFAEGSCQPYLGSVIGLFGLCCNVVLDFCLIYGLCGAPALGGVGCAVSTVISYWLMTFLFLVAIFFNEKHYKSILGKNIFSFQKPIKKTIFLQLAQGGINGLVYFIETIAFTAAILLLSRYGDENGNHVASARIASSLNDLFYLLPLSISMATTILIGEKLGSKAHPKEIGFLKNISLIMGLCTAFVNFIILLSLRHRIAVWFSPTLNIQNLTSALLACTAIYAIPEAIHVICCGILRAYQELSALVWINFLSYCMISLPMGILLGFTTCFGLPILGSIGFWISFICGISCACFISLLKVNDLILKHSSFAKLQCSESKN